MSAGVEGVRTMTKEAYNILIVDDQSGVRYLLETLVTDAGHNAVTAKNGLEAVEAVKRKKPDLVFMDIRMPVMDGFEALDKIKIISPRTEVVMMTANNTEDVIYRALESGAVKCLAKPFNVQDILDAIDEYGWNRSINVLNNEWAL